MSVAWKYFNTLHCMRTLAYISCICLGFGFEFSLRKIYAIVSRISLFACLHKKHSFVSIVRSKMIRKYYPFGCCCCYGFLMNFYALHIRIPWQRPQPQMTHETNKLNEYTRYSYLCLRPMDRLKTDKRRIMLYWEHVVEKGFAYELYPIWNHSNHFHAI